MFAGLLLYAVLGSICALLMLAVLLVIGMMRFVALDVLFMLITVQDKLSVHAKITH